MKGDTFWLGFISLIVIYGSGMGYCLSNLKTLVDDDTSVSMKSLRNELLMGNVLELRSDLESSSIDGYMYIPWIWAFLMKHFIPQVLLILFFNLFFAQTDYGKSIYTVCRWCRVCVCVCVCVCVYYLCCYLDTLF